MYRFFSGKLLSLIAAVGTLAAAQAFAANPPTTYNANTTLNYYNNPYPPLPNWGGAGGAVNTKINDPAFGTPIIRVTNQNSGLATGNPASTPDSASQSNWNTNSTIFHVEDALTGHILAYDFNTSTLVATQITDPLPPQLADFSATEANVCYGRNGTTILSYNFSTKVTTNYSNFQSLVTPNLNGRLGDYSIGSGIFAAVCGGTGQNTDYMCIVYNTNNNSYIVLNTNNAPGTGTGTLTTSSGGHSTFSPGTNCAVTFHNCRIAHGGRYVCLAASDGSAITAIWDTQANSNGGTVYPIGSFHDGHWTFGFGPTENCAWLNNSTNTAHTNATWLLRYVTPTGVNTYYDLCEHPATDPQRWDTPGLDYDSHLSFNNSTSTGAYPVFVDSYHYAADTSDPHCCWGDEIIAIGTSQTGGTNTVYRFAQHRSTQNIYNGNASFYDTPRGNVSQDGLFFMFTSNYGNSLGTYLNTSNNNTTEYREDVFVLKLTPGT